MRGNLVVGLALLLVAVAFAPAAAQAEPPEFGRCLKIPGKTGGFSNKSCTVASSGNNGGYEWSPGAAKTHFTTESKT